MKPKLMTALSAVAMAAAVPAAAQAPSSGPVSNPEGSVNVPAFTLPPSAYLSPEAHESVQRKIRRIQKMRTPEVMAEAAQAPNPVAGHRLIGDKYNFGPSLEAQRRRYAVNMTS